VPFTVPRCGEINGKIELQLLLASGCVRRCGQPEQSIEEGKRWNHIFGTKEKHFWKKKHIIQRKKKEKYKKRKTRKGKQIVK
jgi:hypothetical protein